MRRPANLEAATQLELGMRGVLGGEPFELTGRRCVQGQRGQLWNEWTIELPARRRAAYLAESFGALTLYEEGSLLPTLDPFLVGHDLVAPWLVVARGTATRLAKWGAVGEAPGTYEYVELSARELPARAASVAEGETFVGAPTSADELGLTLLDVPLALVPTANVSAPAGLELWLEVGEVGLLEGIELRVVGVLARQTSLPDEPPLRWQDYLLYNAQSGLRWLSVADGHWSWAVPIEVGPAGYDARASARKGIAATLEWATGALPWSAEIGERATIWERGDLVFERTGSDLSAARTAPLTTDAVARAFRKRSLPRPR